MMTPLKNPSSIRKILSVLVINIILLEVIAAAIVFGIRQVEPNLSLDLVIEAHLDDIAAERTERWKARFHPRLGWISRPHQRNVNRNIAGDEYLFTTGSDGARSDGRIEDDSFLNAYGDSFTEGGEVGDDENWAFFLQEMLDREVKNFGQSAYGVYQAVLKIEEHFQQDIVAKYTVLGIYSDDLNRALNRWRPFLNPSTAASLAFKPSLRFRHGQIQHYDTPVADADQSALELKSIAYDLIETDYWAGFRPNFRSSFPFLYQIILNTRPMVRCPAPILWAVSE